MLRIFALGILLGIFALFCLACAGVAHASISTADEAPKACITHAQALALVESKRAFMGWTIDDYGAEYSKAFIDSINAQPPTTDIKADHLIVLSWDNLVRLILIDHDCVKVVLNVSPAAWQQIQAHVGDTL